MCKDRPDVKAVEREKSYLTVKEKDNSGTLIKIDLEPEKTKKYK